VLPLFIIIKKYIYYQKNRRTEGKLLLDSHHWGPMTSKW